MIDNVQKTLDEVRGKGTQIANASALFTQASDALENVTTGRADLDNSIAQARESAIAMATALRQVYTALIAT